MAKSNHRSTEIITRTHQLIGKAQYAGLYGIPLQRGEGNSVIDFDGNHYIDLLAGASAVTVGYGRSDVIDVYAKTAKKMMHSCFVYSPNEETLLLAEKIISIAPGNFAKKVMFGTSGSDSIDGAIKVARKFTQKQGVISFHNAYHGSTGLSAQATGFPGIRNGFLSGHDFFLVQFPHDEGTAKKVLTETEALLQIRSIACFIIEPIQGDGGNIVPPQRFFQDLFALCRRNEVVVIDDETQSGAGRTGMWWGIEQFGVQPDILVAGKGITGGYIPMSFLVGRSEMIDSLSKAQHVFTYSGHPPSCAVAQKVLSIIKDEKLLDHATKMGELFRKELNQIKEEFAGIVRIEVRGIGLQIGFVIHSQKDHPLATLIGMRCVEQGVYVGYFGPNNDVLRIHPPLTITRDEVIQATQTIRAVLTEFAEGTIPETTIAKHRKLCLGLH